MARRGHITRISAPMASGQPTNASLPAAEKPTAQHVGNIFVTNYYNVLKKLPNELHKFYEDNSMVGRPDDNGVIRSVNKKQAIDQNILLIGDGMQVEIKAVAAQHSVDFGVIVVVKGCLFGVGGVKRGFNQTFFLNPKVVTLEAQHYYISNDIFMYDDDEDLHDHSVVNRSVNENEANEKEVRFTPEEVLVVREKEPVTLVPKVISAAPTTSLAPVVKATVSEKPLTPPAKVISATSTTSVVLVSEAPVVEKPITPVTKVIGAVLTTSGGLTAKAPTTENSETPEEEVIRTAPLISVAPVANMGFLSVARGETPKISYPSIVNAPKDIRAPIAVPPSVSAKPQPSKLTTPATNQPSKLSAPTSSKVSYVSSSTTEESFSQEVDCCSVFVGNLPMNVTVNQLREEFKKFGAIKPNRIQIRRNEERRFCFAFLEFELASAATRAIKTSTMMFGGHSVFIKEKRRNAPRRHKSCASRILFGSTSWRASGREYRNGGSTGRGGSSGR